MLFRNKNGTVIQINLFDHANDASYYKKIKALKQDYSLSPKNTRPSLDSFIQQSSKDLLLEED